MSVINRMVVFSDLFLKSIICCTDTMLMPEGLAAGWRFLLPSPGCLQHQGFLPVICISYDTAVWSPKTWAVTEGLPSDVRAPDEFSQFISFPGRRLEARRVLGCQGCTHAFCRKAVAEILSSTDAPFVIVTRLWEQYFKLLLRHFGQGIEQLFLAPSSLLLHHYNS